MTFHQKIVTDTPADEPFVWPDLPDAPAVPNQQMGEIPLQIAGQVVTLTGPCPISDGPVMVTTQIGQEKLRVFVPDAGVGALLGLHGVSDDHRNYTPATTAIVVEHLMVSALDRVATALDCDVTVVRVGGPGKAKPEIGVSATLPDQSKLSIGLSGSKDILANLVAALSANETAASRPALDNLPFPVALLGPTFHIPADALAQCKPGDGLLLERDWSSLTSTSLSVAGCICGDARQTQEGFVLITRPTLSRTNTQEKETPMSMTETPEAASLPVTLRICLGETTLTLSQIGELEEGSVLPFAQEPPTTVDISANGQPFGRGDLVRIDGQVGIRLTKIGQDTWKT